MLVILEEIEAEQVMQVNAFWVGLCVTRCGNDVDVWLMGPLRKQSLLAFVVTVKGNARVHMEPSNLFKMSCLVSRNATTGRCHRVTEEANHLTGCHQRVADSEVICYVQVFVLLVLYSL